MSSRVKCVYKKFLKLKQKKKLIFIFPFNKKKKNCGCVSYRILFNYLGTQGRCSKTLWVLVWSHKGRKGPKGDRIFNRKLSRIISWWTNYIKNSRFCIPPLRIWEVGYTINIKKKYLKFRRKKNHWWLVVSYVVHYRVIIILHEQHSLHDFVFFFFFCVNTFCC